MWAQVKKDGSPLGFSKKRTVFGPHPARIVGNWVFYGRKSANPTILGGWIFWRKGVKKNKKKKVKKWGPGIEGQKMVEKGRNRVEMGRNWSNYGYKSSSSEDCRELGVRKGSKWVENRFFNEN